MNVEDFRVLYEFNSWANQRTLDSCAALTQEQFTRDLGSSFKSVRDTLVHIFSAQWIWLERWHGRVPAAFPNAADFPDFASVKRRWREVESDLSKFIAPLQPEQLDRVLHYKLMSGAAMEGPLWPMLQHLVNHGTYHRGQIATMLRQLGAKPNSTDMIAFYRERAARTPVS